MTEPIKVFVECYSGYRADERPTRFSVWGKTLEVKDVLDEWQGEDHRYFKVKASDEATYILRQDTLNDFWELTLYQRKISS